MAATVFGPEWNDLTLDHIRDFLSTNPEEGLTWEAKGELPRPDSLLKQADGFANQVGGILLLGPAKTDEGWHLGSIQFPGGDASTWVSSILRSGLRPVPAFDVKTWEVEQGRLAAVRIDSVAVPPCLTRTGAVYERVSGQTVPVTEPLVLQGLYSTGDSARTRAREVLPMAREKSWGFAPGAGEAELGVTITAASLSTYGSDHGSWVFTRSTRERLKSLPGDVGLLDSRAGRPGQFGVTPSQEGLKGKGHHTTYSWAAWLGRRGEVGVVGCLRGQAWGIDILWEDVVVPASRAAESLLSWGRAEGETLFELSLRPWVRGVQIATSRASTSLRDTVVSYRAGEARHDPSDLEFVQREVLRASEIEAWEPEHGHGA